jgi:hypothetical protein
LILISKRYLLAGITIDFSPALADKAPFIFIQHLALFEAILEKGSPHGKA